MPKVSVIIPTFNSAEYLYDTLESVVGQEYHNFEIIIVDGGSVDDTEKIVQKFQSYHSNVLFLKNHNDQGPAHSRLFGIQNSSGDFIAFIDSDDIWLPTKLSKQIKYMFENNLDFTFTDYVKISRHGDVISNAICGHDRNTYRQYLRRRGIANSTVVVRRSVIGDVWDDKIANTHAEDTLWWLALMKYRQVEAIRLPGSYTFYRISPQGRSRKVVKNQASIWTLYRKNLELGIFQTMCNYAGYVSDVAFRRLKSRFF